MDLKSVRSTEKLFAIELERLLCGDLIGEPHSSLNVAVSVTECDSLHFIPADKNFQPKPPSLLRGKDTSRTKHLIIPPGHRLSPARSA